MKSANYNPKISVIIAAYNESNKIDACLKSLSGQSVKDIEVILVDDCSSDQTVLITQQISPKLGLNLKIIRLGKHQERSAARNTGAKESKGAYLFFIDADMELSKHVVAQCVKLVQENPDIKAVIVPEKSFGEGFWARCRSLEKLCYIGDDRMEAARFFEKKAFYKVGGWDKKMISGEDWDLTRRIRSKNRIGRILSTIYHHEYQLTLWKAMKKKFYYARVSGIYLERNPLTLLGLIFFIFRPGFIRNWRLIFSDPLHGTGMLFLKTMELSAGVAGYLVSRLPNRL